MGKRNTGKKTIKSNYKRRRNANISSNINYFLLILFVVGVFGAMFYYSFTSKPSVKIDKLTFCPLDKTLTKSHVIFLVDATDKIPSRYTLKLQNFILDAEQKMNKYDKLTILVLSAEVDDYIKEKFSMCSPGRGKDINPLVGSEKIAEYTWRKNFHAPLEKYIRDLTKLQEAKRTPLFNAINQIMSRLDFDNNVPTRHLVILSDMMHSTKDFSNYRRRIKLDALNNNFIKSFDFNFDGVDVSVELIRREKIKKYQTKKFKKFWKHFFEDNNANSFQYF